MNNTRRRKKQTGSFYTPKTLAHLLAREVLACLPSKTDLKNLRILDPAAGEGGLLLPFAQELATLRRKTEPNKTRTQILQDIWARQLYAADICQEALAKLPLPAAHLYHGDALEANRAKSVLQPLAPKGFDIILANPPYIGQKGHADVFNKLRQNPLWGAYVTPKNDLSYYFFYLALHLLKKEGLAGFITPPYFATAAGGKLLRQTLREESTFLRLLNFEEQQLFSDADPHTLLSVFQKGQTKFPCQVGENLAVVEQTDLFYGEDLFLQTRPVLQTGFLHKMAQAPHTLGEIAQVSTGLMTGCDRAFILTDAQKKVLPLTKKELAKLKPFFKNSDIFPYAPNTQARLWLIDFFYPNDRDLHIKDYPHLIAHLHKFKTRLLARKQNNNGIDKQLAKGNFWFGSVRRKLNFEGEKLVLPHRAATLLAAYSKGPWYASSDVYFVTNPKPPYTLWTLLGLLNSSPYFTWISANGKRKGKLLELYAAPLQQLPIPTLTPAQQARLEKLARAIYQHAQDGSTSKMETLQGKLDKLVASCF